MGRNGKFYRLLRYDMKNSAVQNRWRWLGAAALFFFLSHAAAESFFLMGEEPGIEGIFLYLIRGAGPYTRTKDSRFELPVFWFLYHLYFFYLIGEYPAKEMHGYGRQVFLWISDRRLWWFSKCVWAAVQAALYEAVFFFAAFLYLAAGGHRLTGQTAVVLGILQVESQGAVGLAVLEYLAAVAWTGWLLLLFSLILSPVLAVLITAALLVCACYFDTALLAGNFMMLARSCGIGGNLRLLGEGAVLLPLFSVVLLLFGAKFIEKYPFMG